jgi:tRNA modification GTPase
LVLLLLDARLGETAADREILSQLPQGLPRIRVMNKVDLTQESPRIERSTNDDRCATTVWLSARTGAGIELLRTLLMASIGWRGGSEGLYMARERHLQALTATRNHVAAAREHNTELELLAEELRLGQTRLAEITGEFSADDLLGEIFQRFCIGK